MAEDFSFFDFNLGGGDEPQYFSDYADVGSFYQPEADTFDFQMPEFNLTGQGLTPEDRAAFWGQGGGWAEPQQSAFQYEQPMAYGGGEVAGFDPSTGVFYDRAGNPIQPQGGGPTGGPQTPGGQVAQANDIQTGQGLVYDPIANVYRNALGEAAGGGSAAGPGGPAGPGVPTSPTQMGGPGGAGGQAQPGGGGWGDMIGNFLKSPVGGILGALGVGGAGLAAARGIAGPVPKAPVPTLAPGSPTVGAGQNAVADFYLSQLGREAGYQAEQAPGYQNIRQQAMTLIPGQLNPVTLENYQDPVQQAMRAELMATMQPGYADPATERQIRQDWNTLQNQLYKLGGNNPEWQYGSTGQEAIARFQESADIRRQQAKQAAINTYAPGEQARGQFAYTAPVDKARALGGEQRAYFDTLANASNIGRMAPGEMAGYFGSPDQYRLPMTNLAYQGQMANFGARSQDRQQTMAGIGGLAGTVAGQVGSLGTGDRLARAVRELGINQPLQTAFRS